MKGDPFINYKVTRYPSRWIKPICVRGPKDIWLTQRRRIWDIYWIPEGKRSYKNKIVPIISLFISSKSFFAKTAPTIFLKLCTMLDIDRLRKVTEPDYPKIFRIIQNVR